MFIFLNFFIFLHPSKSFILYRLSNVLIIFKVFSLKYQKRNPKCFLKKWFASKCTNSKSIILFSCYRKKMNFLSWPPHTLISCLSWFPAFRCQKKKVIYNFIIFDEKIFSSLMIFLYNFIFENIFYIHVAIGSGFTRQLRTTTIISEHHSFFLPTWYFYVIT